MPHSRRFKWRSAYVAAAKRSGMLCAPGPSQMMASSRSRSIWPSRSPFFTPRHDKGSAPALSRACPFRLVLGAPSRLWISGAQPDELPVLSCGGVRQGVPLAPLLFALVLQPILEHLCKCHPDCPLAAYADDVVLQGTPVALADAFFVLKARCANVGLQVNAQKCNVCTRAPTAPRSRLLQPRA
jgi:hypothetical protein